MEIAGLILGILGLFGLPTIIWFCKHELLSRYWSLTRSPETLRAALTEIVMKRSFPFEHTTNVGMYGPVEVSWFVDLLAATCDPSERQLLDRLMTRWIYLMKVKPTKVAVPKLGNVILGMTVAQRLGLPLVIVRQEAKHEIGRCQPFDGSVDPGDHVLLIDDVASDCEFLRLCIEKIRYANARVIAVIVLVNRPEGLCNALFEKENVPFYALMNINDEQISDLKR